MKTLVILLSLMLAAPAQAATTVPAPQNTVTSSKQTIDQKKLTARKAVADKKLSTAKKASLDGKSSAKKQPVGTVTFKSSMHCENCVKKLTDNLAYSKGVKDLDISLEKNKITVTYDAAKTSEETLAGIIRKLGYEAVCEQPGK